MRSTAYCFQRAHSQLEPGGRLLQRPHEVALCGDGTSWHAIMILFMAISFSVLISHSVNYVAQGAELNHRAGQSHSNSLRVTWPDPAHPPSLRVRWSKSPWLNSWSIFLHARLEAISKVHMRSATFKSVPTWYTKWDCRFLLESHSNHR